MGPTMRTEEVAVLEDRLTRRFSRLLLRRVLPAFAVLVIGMVLGIIMIMHAAVVDKYDRCSDGVDGRAVTRGLFIAIADAVRDDGDVESADFLRDIVDRDRPPEDKQAVCGPRPGWWST